MDEFWFTAKRVALGPTVVGHRASGIYGGARSKLGLWAYMCEATRYRQGRVLYESVGLIANSGTV